MYLRKGPKWWVNSDKHGLAHCDQLGHRRGGHFSWVFDFRNGLIYVSPKFDRSKTQHRDCAWRAKPTGLVDCFRFFIGHEDKVLESHGQYQPGEWFSATCRDSKRSTGSIQDQK